MKLVRGLNTRLINSRKVSYGLFLCSFCNKEIERQLSNGKRDKSCGCAKDKLTGIGNKHKKRSEDHKIKIGLANKGHIVTEETRQKLSKIGKGRKVTEEIKQKISESEKGKIISEETKQKIINNHKDFTGINNPFYGKKHTEESKQKIRETMLKNGTTKGSNNPMYGKKGELSPIWQDGKSFEPYGLEFNKEIKNYILERDNYECQCPDCLLENTKLVIHHIDYDKKNSKVENLITLCRKCHSRTNGKNNRQYWINYYKKIMEDIISVI